MRTFGEKRIMKIYRKLGKYRKTYQELLLEMLSLGSGLAQEEVVDLAPAPLVLVEHIQQLLSRHGTSPATLNLCNEIALLAEMLTCLDTSGPTLQLSDGPQDAGTSALHVFLE